MKRMLAGWVVALAAATLSGCYYDPGYSYVRSNGYQGDAYYGEGRPVIYDDGYAPSYYGPTYYGDGYYAPGVSVGISSVWYGGSGHRGRDHDWRGDRHWHGEGRGGYDRDDRGDHDRGHWQGRRDEQHSQGRAYRGDGHHDGDRYHRRGHD